MTAAEAAYWMKANRRAQSFAPDIRSAILRAFEIIRESLTDSELEAIIASGRVDELFTRALTEAVLDRAFIPLRQRIRQSTERAFKYAVADLPKGGKVDGVVSVMFDHLNPDVITAVRDLDTKVITTLKADTRETVKAFVENGLRDGEGPRAIAREIRNVVGLAPSQEVYVRNLAVELESGDYASAARRALLDKRFNLAKLDSLSAAEKSKRIDTIVNAYRKSWIAQNAQVNAHTASLDAMKVGQKLSWQSAIDRGIVDGSRLTKRWSGVMDDRERPEHVEMQGETVPWNSFYSNGEDTPGDSTFNCRCVSIFRQTNPP